ncbi:alpha/beta hydrolase [Actinoplanes sp. CA-252034]|uniref:alpha/beta hydrolase n=1 Tax=Actinoplanes sp. CA-252034 TaxID=3239906 RepID=UPI003D95C2D7
MSALTLRQLLATDVTPWHTAAETWQKLAQGLDDAAERLIRGTRDLAHVWPSGAGATAGHERAARLRTELSNVYNPARRIFDAMDQHAYGMSTLRRQAEEILAAARQSGFTVDTATLDITAPAGLYQGGMLDQTARAIGGLAGDLRSVVEQARALDDSTANTVTVNVPTAGTAFGLSRMDPITADDLRAQAGRTPEQVNGWWRVLTPEQQEQAIRDHPDLVGWLDGIPAGDRDLANRAILDRETAALTGRLGQVDARIAYLQSMLDQGRLYEVYPHEIDPRSAADRELLNLGAEREPLSGKVDGLTAIRDRLANPQPPAFLLGLSTADDGRAIVSVNNPDTANNVLTYVPGTTADLAGSRGDIDRADKMAADAGHTDPAATTASIYWLGYDAPDLIPNAASDSYAEKGATELSGFQSGLRATHEGDVPSRNTVLGHSYGSTVMGHSAMQSGFEADAAIFVGSPGVDVNHVSELPGLPSNEIYATRAEHDMIKWIPDLDAAHGNDPVRSDFGAWVFPSDPGDAVRQDLTHSAYWENGNIARKNIARIVTGGL